MRMLTLPYMTQGKKWTIKGNDKHHDANSVFHNTTDHIQCLYQISKS